MAQGFSARQAQMKLRVVSYKLVSAAAFSLYTLSSGDVEHLRKHPQALQAPLHVLLFRLAQEGMAFRGYLTHSVDGYVRLFSFGRHGFAMLLRPPAGRKRGNRCIRVCAR
jgi:hypothetical protein